MNKTSYVWHPNTQMKEWDSFSEIKSAKGVWLTDSKGNKMIDAVASMWCNVWGHSNAQLIKCMQNQSKRLQHSSLFNLTNEPAEKLAKKLVSISPKMYKVFFSDNGSSAMEIAIKMSLQYWKNIGEPKKRKIATLKNGYHGDTFGAMSVGYVPEFFQKFKKQLFSTIQFDVPNSYRIPKGLTFHEYQNQCIEKIEKRFAKKDDVAAFVMESGAQVAGGVIIYPDSFQKKISELCKKYHVLFVLDEIATGFGRLGSMIQYQDQKSIPDIVAFGKMLTGGYLTMAATLANKKIYDSFLGEFKEWKHLFHGHTYTGNPMAASIANENLEMYQKKNLIAKIQKTTKVFEKYYQEISDIDIVGDIRHKGMLMGIDLVSDKNRKTPINPKKSINKIFFEEGKKHGIYLRTLGNIVMIVPPLYITENELDLLMGKVVKTINSAKSQLI
ncbi:MAG: adenosylmethionine--8-amino-7-oxononanoate transaminase [Nitrosopumilus sp.]|nr:adenosylmethionine--8-amino-7-oxononanoate transaminase [Nitrosopumilus sp.]